MDRKIPNIKVHIIITMSSTIWVTVLVAKMAIKTTNRGSYLEVTFEANRHTVFSISDAKFVFISLTLGVEEHICG